MGGRVDKLEEAANRKQEGNDLYKSGKFEDARRYYNQVLDLLTSQTELTNGEKEKRDNLVLTSHLNLAACELKLGDNAKVIQHCSLALQMDKKSIKAYFRRGQAYHNNQEYDLAFIDYVEAQRLEPKNPEIRKQMRYLLADKEEEECQEMVVVYEDDDEEAALRDYDKRCHKAARHNEFIPVSQFCLEHLPEQYRTETVLACLKALISLTVLVRVRGSSSDRPEFVPRTKNVKYPCSGPEYRNVVRTGSGHVVDVQINTGADNKVCPCDTCKNSGNPKTQFAEIRIDTAAHVLFDLVEGKKTNCYFDYDSDQTDRNTCPKLSKAVKVRSSAVSDASIAFFVTHDLDSAEKLENIREIYKRLCRQIRLDLGIIHYEDEEQMELSVKFSNFCEKFQKTVQKLSQDINKFKKIRDGDARQMLEDYRRQYGLKPGETIRTLYGAFLYDKMKGGDEWEKNLTNLENAYTIFVTLKDHLRYNKDKFDAYLDRHGYKDMLESYQRWRHELSTLNKILQVYLAEHTDQPAGDTNGDYYNSLHPFTVIVSHPHGLEKKVSLGEVKERIFVDDLGHDWCYCCCSYHYTNTTCPGSSGAPVFIMGRSGLLLLSHIHSKMSQLQRNESVTFHDI